MYTLILIIIAGANRAPAVTSVPGFSYDECTNAVKQVANAPVQTYAYCVKGGPDGSTRPTR